MIVNQNRNTTIACKPFHAVRLWDRTRGMIGREFGEAFDAMVFSACNAIHTFFMKIPLDVLFLNRENTVVAQRSSLRQATETGTASAIITANITPYCHTPSGMSQMERMRWRMISNSGTCSMNTSSVMEPSAASGRKLRTF